MGVEPILDSRAWAAVPFEFWSAAVFVFGCIVGSFLNVCIHRMPLNQSIVSPPSHCPHCRYSIPWYLNIPLVTWISLRGRCRNCGAPISVRYFLVELLTGLAWLAAWIAYGHASALQALVLGVFLSGLIAATFIDFEHFIIPDEITIGGIMAGIIASVFIPRLQSAENWVQGGVRSAIGIAAGAGIVYVILRVGKLLFGRQRIRLEPDVRIYFTETALRLPDRVLPYEELFYRQTDRIALNADIVEMADRCYRGVRVELTPGRLLVGEDAFNPEEVPHLEVVSAEVVLPREAMGLGDVKFMAAIGAFLGWQAVLFSLLASSMIGSVVGVGLILAGKKEWSSRLPYGPYIAMAAAVWVFGGRRLVDWFFGF